MKTLLIACILSFAIFADSADAADRDAFYTEEQVFRMRPNPDREKIFGHVGATGILLRVHRDVTLKVGIYSARVTSTP